MLRTLLALGAGLALTGCAAGGGGPQRQPPAVVPDPHSVHLSGEMTDHDTSYHVDVRLTDDAALGRVTAEGRDFEVLKVDGKLYLKGGAGFYDGTGTSPEAAATLRDKYVVIPPEDPAYQRLAVLTDRRALIGTGTLRLTDPGVRVTVTAPPPSRVVDLGALTSSLMGR